MRKLLLVLSVIFSFFSTSSYSAVSGNMYYVDGFIESTQAAPNLLQDTTGANYSCGPTSVLYVYNYYWMKTFNFPAYFTVDIMSALMGLEDVYDNMNISFNTSKGTDTDQLKSLVKNIWNWNTAAKASGNNSISYNFLTMINRIKENYPVILALEKNYNQNPIGGFAHIVVFYKYDTSNQCLYYFDPYYGDTHSIGYSDLSNAIQGNLPYLRIAPGLGIIIKKYFVVYWWS